MKPGDPVDLTNCDREPIHIPGAIQPHGVLLACRGESLLVTQASANAAAVLEVEIDALLGASIERVLTAASWLRLSEAAGLGFPRDVNPLALESRAGVQFDGIAHRAATPGVTIIELEPKQSTLVGFHPRMRASVRQLQAASNLQELYDIAAAEMRMLTGFDRVMIYRFDRDWNGEVVAEARRHDLEPFHGLHYPAADIPAQARRLYTLNWLRIIPDIAYQPVPLVPQSDPETRAPLDLSFSVLRSVSPIHVEYMRNMAVTASMSVSLLRDDELAGLIACHHYSGPHHVPFIVRETAEFLGQALSWHVAAFEARDAAERAFQTQRCESSIVNAIAAAPSIPEGLCTPALTELVGASGATLVFEGRMYRVGSVPADDDVRRILRAIEPEPGAWVSATDRLADRLPEAAAWDDVAAGAMALEISRELGEHVIWYRAATDRTVDWAGDPRKVEVHDDRGVPRLSPRGSFALWREMVRGRSLPWEPWQIEAALNLRRVLLGGIRRRADELRVLNDQLATADRMKDEFLATVGHELRTPLNAMLGWIHILRQQEDARRANPAAPDNAERRARAFDTVERNARAQAQLIDDLLDVSRIVAGKLTLAVSPVAFGTVVESAIEALRPAAEARHIRVQSALDSTALILGDAQRLQQVATNLLSNAVKFTPKGGKVQVFVERRESSVDLTVADTGQGIAPEFLPHVFERFRQADGSVARKTSGLGLGLAIVRHIVELHGGTVSVESDGEGRGATFTVKLPMSVAVRREVPVQSQDRRNLVCPPELARLRILVVDDEPDAREMLRALLEECQAEVETAASAAQGLERAAAFQPHVIVSDIGMPEVDGYAFIEELRRRSPAEGGRIPAVALTAHARVEDRARALYAGFNNHVPKPVEPLELFAVLSALVSRSQ